MRFFSALIHNASPERITDMAAAVKTPVTAAMAENMVISNGANTAKIIVATTIANMMAKITHPLPPPQSNKPRPRLRINNNISKPLPLVLVDALLMHGHFLAGIDGIPDFTAHFSAYG